MMWKNKNIDHPERKTSQKKEFKAIRALRSNDDIIIKPAEKGSSIVIMDKAQYVNEGNSN